MFATLFKNRAVHAFVHIDPFFSRREDFGNSKCLTLLGLVALVSNIIILLLLQDLVFLPFNDLSGISFYREEE